MSMAQLAEQTLRRNAVVTQLTGGRHRIVKECVIRREIRETPAMKRWFDSYKVVLPIRPRQAFSGFFPL
jgi:hypothetical protein